MRTSIAGGRVFVISWRTRPARLSRSLRAFIFLQERMRTELSGRVKIGPGQAGGEFAATSRIIWHESSLVLCTESPYESAWL
jgi:hypothetical protein